jgi:hypothetical protein
MGAAPSASDVQPQEPASRAKTSRIGDFQPSHLEWARPLLQAIFNDRNRRHGKDRKHRRPSARTHRMSAPSSASDARPQELPPRQRPQASETFSPHSQNERALFGKRRSPPGTTSTAKTASIGDVQPSTFNLQPSTFNLQPSTFNLQPSTLNSSPAPHYRYAARSRSSMGGI